MTKTHVIAYLNSVCTDDGGGTRLSTNDEMQYVRQVVRKCGMAAELLQIVSRRATLNG